MGAGVLLAVGYKKTAISIYYSAGANTGFSEFLMRN